MTTLADLASGYYSHTLGSEDIVRSIFEPLVRDGTVTIDELNSALLHPTKWTGSGRQGSGLTDLSNMWFDNQGYAYLSETGTTQNVNNTSSRDSGYSFWNPTYDLESGYGWNESGNPITYDFTNKFRYDDLSAEARNRIATEGLFPNINKSFSNLGVTSNIGIQDLNTTINSVLKPYLSNIGQKESEGWLLNEGIGTLLSGLGMLLPGNVGAFMNLAGQSVNTANSVANGNIGSAVLNGIGMYNTAGNMANASNFNNTNPTSMGNQVYTQFNPSEYLSNNILGIENPTVGRYVGNAGVEAVRAGLDGEDVGRAIRNSVIRTGTNDMAQSLGLNEFSTGLLNQGLSYILNNPQYNTNNRTQQTTTNNNTQQTTQPVQMPTQTQQQYTLANPITVPTYTNPFGNVPSPYTPSYGQPQLAIYDEDVDDESDTQNPYNTSVNYSGSGQNTYG